MAKHLRVGTDCAGMEAPMMALANLKIKYRHTFSCDIDKRSRTTIEANFPPEVMYEDLTKRMNTTAAPSDLYVAGFPCQPFSGAGKMGGFGDERGVLFFYILDYIRHQQPKVFMLENVAFLAKIESGMYLQRILQELNRLGNYNVDYEILNSQDHGVPQFRNRIYFCGIRKDVDKGHFTWPKPIPTQSIERFLDSRDRELARSGLPPATQTTAIRNVQLYIQKLRKEGKKPYKKAFIIDCDSSTYRSKACQDKSPCITCTRSNGHWITNRGRRMNKAEVMRLMGMNPKKIKVAVTENALGHQLGNTMSVNVLERIFVRLLPAAGLVRKNELVDRWENGTALKALEKTRDYEVKFPKGPAKKQIAKPGKGKNAKEKQGRGKQHIASKELGDKPKKKFVCDEECYIIKVTMKQQKKKLTPDKELIIAPIRRDVAFPTAVPLLPMKRTQTTRLALPVAVKRTRSSFKCEQP